MLARLRSFESIFFLGWGSYQGPLALGGWVNNLGPQYMKCFYLGLSGFSSGNGQIKKIHLPLHRKGQFWATRVPIYWA